MMDRLVLMPQGVGFWRKIFYSFVLTSVEAFLALLCLMAGVPIVIDPSSIAPNSVSRLLPEWLLYVWGSGLVLGGGLSLIGIASSEYRIERIGVMFLACATFIHAVALAFLLPASLLAMFINTGFMLTMLARYWVLGKIILLIKRLNRRYVVRPK
jgi:hypothetical protein